MVLPPKLPSLQPSRRDAMSLILRRRIGGLGIFIRLCSIFFAGAVTILIVLPAAAVDNSIANTAGAATTQAAPSEEHGQIHAKASWYGPGLEGKTTSSGEVFDPQKLTAASSKIPLGATAQVKNLENGRKVTVKVNDCGPMVKGRNLDLSSRAADKLKMKQSGVVPVEVKILKKPKDAPICSTN
jgi:rare lipoprotein A (peptidoglycan hydrolase)